MIALKPGDAFVVNGHFGCVVHAAKARAVILIMDDNMPYTVTRSLAETLVQAFKNDPRVVEVATR